VVTHGLGQTEDRRQVRRIALTGTWTGITSAAPGQVFHGNFADFSHVEVRLA
jgi:hypothetical protein